jgi:hypothetical protein
MAELNVQIVRQLEFYFSRANLSQDKFMVEQIATGTDRFISLETMLKFNKLKALTTDSAVIVEALASSDILEVNEEKNAIRGKEDTRPNADLKEYTIEGQKFTCRKEIVQFYRGILTKEGGAVEGEYRGGGHPARAASGDVGAGRAGEGDGG